MRTKDELLAAFRTAHSDSARERAIALEVQVDIRDQLARTNTILEYIDGTLRRQR